MSRTFMVVKGFELSDTTPKTIRKCGGSNRDFLYNQFKYLLKEIIENGPRYRGNLVSIEIFVRNRKTPQKRKEIWIMNDGENVILYKNYTFDISHNSEVCKNIDAIISQFNNIEKSEVVLNRLLGRGVVKNVKS